MNATQQQGGLTRWLERAPRPVFVLFAIATSFTAYFCMYAFRKPFAAGTYEGGGYAGVELKTVFVVSQILGYAASKYIGIKVCSEATRGRRAVYLVGLVLCAHAALLLFAVLPAGGKVLAIFLNGLPLGMVWGLVVWYLEGRRTSELLLAGLSCSFIVASAVVKDVGVRLMNEWGVSEWWMPFTTGACFLPFFIASVWLLDQIPEPSAADEAARVEREPMGRRERRSFIREFLPGIVLLLIVYFFLTAYRDFRDNYGREIFISLGYAATPDVFSRSDIPVALGVLLPLALLYLIRDNRLALAGAYAIMVSGLVLMGIGTALFDAGRISGLAWMVVVGLGAYLAYVPFGSVFFDRLIASTRVAGTAVFAIYVADAVGYTGSVGVQLYRDLFRGEAPRLEFFRGFTYFQCVLGAILLVLSAIYFLAKTRRATAGAPHDREDAPA